MICRAAQMLALRQHRARNVGAAEDCDLLIFSGIKIAKDQKIAAFGPSYGD
jgi:hypothetical protein